MVRKVTIAAFERWIEDEENVETVLRLISEGTHLHKACVVVKQPYNCLHAYFHSTPERLERYVGARKAWADRKMDEAMDLADGAKPDKGHVAKAKLQVETRENQAKAYHRERWGDQVKVEREVNVGVDAGLLGVAGDLLRLAVGGLNGKPILPRDLVVHTVGRPVGLPALPAALPALPEATDEKDAA